jgi:hypothetical protein
LPPLIGFNYFSGCALEKTEHVGCDITFNPKAKATEQDFQFVFTHPAALK